jgi:hypothetical protein
MNFGFSQLLRLFPNPKLLLHASHAALPILNSKLPPVLVFADLMVLQIIDKTIRNSKFRCLSEATPPITITSSLSHYSYKDERV